MKKFILHTSLFLLFTTIFYVISIIIWGHFAPPRVQSNVNYRIGSYGHMKSRLTEVKNYHDLDILFLGSSLSYRGFDPRIFSKHGYNTFNLGSSSQTPIQSKLLLDRYVASLNPKRVIYEVNPISFSLDGVESSLDIIANDKNDLRSLKMATKINNIKTYNTLIYGYISDLIGLNESFTEPVIKKRDRYVSRGFVEREMAFYKPEKFDEVEILLNQNQLTFFSEIVQLLKSKNVELILVFPPISKVKYESFTNTSQFDSIMKGYATYYNFNELVSMNDSLHFYDPGHLNQNGVDIFNNKLIEVLGEL